ncbi:DNA primase [Novosphingobium sp. Gsoil 351]|uniref:DNA primase n=1 Tax=Novosphingobium sp. Gsoil 351 TaxID=2675225 RepID=UPI0012B47C01|nr:DNA primase [Novosphingobium sp. Gsoil 351]QGN53884.1 DNA primase [Novosphingobium sp. Gsoil 351]
MSLSPAFLDELRARISLSGVIGRTTRLTKAGREFKACCPFHSEKSPSFTVNDDKGFYHCFGCGAHGDVIRWLTDQRGLAFMDAVKELAGEAGMELPAMDPRAAEKAKERQGLDDVMAAAQAWFVERLRSDEGAAARKYLAGRGFAPAVVELFGFGFAPEGRQALKTGLGAFPEALLIEAGLRIVVEDPSSTTKREPYDRFRARLMLPIRNPRGQIVGFGGRILDAAKTDAPKYLNSPDTPIFDKGRTLYNLDKAAPLARKSGRLVVVEGYMDVVALANAGIEEAVAPLGTALTEAQLELAWRVCETPLLCFDGDAAGQRAAMRAMVRALPLLRPAHSLAICRMPQGLDPDDLLKAQGPQALLALLGQATPLVEALWQAERDAQPCPTPEAKAGLKARLLAHVDAIAHPDIRSLYRRELLDRFGGWAFPARPAREPRGAFRRGPALPDRLDPGVAHRLNRAADESPDKLLGAVIAGFLRFPASLVRHSDALARLAPADSRIAALIDVLVECGDGFGDVGQVLDRQGIATILVERKLQPPAIRDYAGLPFAFLAEDADPAAARADLAEAMALLVERPALEAALAAAEKRFAEDPEGAFAEQQRLLQTRLALERRMMQRATARAGAETGTNGSDGDH